MQGRAWIVAAFFLTVAVPSGAHAGPVALETKSQTSPAADPFVGFVSVGPEHRFEPIYRVLEPGACPLLAFRVLILDYANYDNIVVEELGFSGSKCRDRYVRKSWSINGVTLGYALGEGTRFARNLKFKGWDAFDSFIVRSGEKDFSFRIREDGQILAEPSGRALLPGSDGP